MKDGWQCRWLPLSLPIDPSWASLWVQPTGEITGDKSEREEGFSVKREMMGLRQEGQEEMGWRRTGEPGEGG